MKTIPQIEHWVLSLLDDIKSKRAVEDARIELKAKLPPPAKAARQIAGHANAAHGQDILWVVGIDEKHGIVPFVDDDIATWFSQVKSFFDGEAPAMIDVRVTCDGGKVLSLLFDTTRVPFVVKRDLTGDVAADEVHREIPWRSGTMVRSARRHELFSVLMPLEILPQVEILGADLMSLQDSPNSICYWHMAVNMFMVPSSNRLTVIPIHKCDAVAWIAHELDCERLDRLNIIASGPSMGEKQSSSFFSTGSEIVFDRPGCVTLTSRTYRNRIMERGPPAARVRITMKPANANSRIAADLSFRQTDDWKYVLSTHAVIPEIAM